MTSGNVDFFFFFGKNWQCGFTIDVMAVRLINLCGRRNLETIGLHCLCG